MTPYYESRGVAIYCGDALTVLRTLGAASVQCVVTSPPYWGLRDYGTATWEGGDPNCAHRGRVKPRNDTSGSGVEKGRFAETRGTQPAKTAYAVPVREICKCGARRVDAQLGLEATPDAYVARMVEVFAEVRRVLRDDGTLWLNLGDSYGGHQPGNGRGTNPERATLANGGSTPHRSAHEKRGAGIKEKDLVGIPWMVAFALRADGWHLRSDIIWEKPSAMPESVADRPTNAHEHLFLLAKCGRYFYDAGAIAEPVSPNTHARLSQNVAAQIGSARANGGTRPDRPMKAVVRAPKTRHGDEQAVRPKNNSGFAEHCCMPVERRNRRNVWRIASQPFTGAHFATFPPALVEPCILAGSKPGDVVLDPFTGTGTVAAVARDHGRRSVGIELNPDYIDLAAKRLAQGVLDFGGVA